MPPPAAHEDNLQELIAGARRSIERAEAARIHPDRPGGLSGGRAGRLLRGGLLALLCVVGWFASADARRLLWGTPEAVTMEESRQTLTAAREAVERHHQMTGEWPRQVPLPHLDALVRLTQPGDGYVLSVQLDGRAYTMGHDGQFARSAP